MEVIIGIGIIIAIIAGIGYGLYLLCALIWNTSVCYVVGLDAAFSISLIILVIIAVIGAVVLIVGLVGDFDGCIFTVVKIFVPAILCLGAIAGLIATYGMVEFALFDGCPVEPSELADRENLPSLPIEFESMGTIGQFFGSAIFIGVIVGVLSILATIFIVLYGGVYPEEFWKPLIALIIPALLIGGGLFGWSWLIVFYVWDYPLFDAIIHGAAISAGILGAIAALTCLLWKGADWGAAGDYGGEMAGFCLGLGAAICVVAYFVFGVKILLDLMSEYYLWIILGFVGLYILLGVVYCLTRLHKIKEFISDGVYYYWHK